MTPRRLALASGFAGSGRPPSPPEEQKVSHLYIAGYAGKAHIVRLEELAEKAVKDLYKTTVLIRGFPFPREVAKTYCPTLVDASEHYLLAITSTLQGPLELTFRGGGLAGVQEHGHYSEKDELQRIKERADKAMHNFYLASWNTYRGIGYGALEIPLTGHSGEGKR